MHTYRLMDNGKFAIPNIDIKKGSRKARHPETRTECTFLTPGIFSIAKKTHAEIVYTNTNTTAAAYRVGVLGSANLISAERSNNKKPFEMFRLEGGIWGV